MIVGKLALTAVVTATALCGVVSPAYASEAPVPSHTIGASGASLSPYGGVVCVVAGGKLAILPLLQQANVSGGGIGTAFVEVRGGRLVGAVAAETASGATHLALARGGVSASVVAHLVR